MFINYCICFLPRRRLPSQTRASSLVIKSCVLSVGCWKLICTCFALIEVSWLVNIKWFYWVNLEHECSPSLLQLAVHTGHTPREAALVRSIQPPWVGISLVIKEVVVYEKKKTRSFQVPVSSACSSLGNGYNLTFLKLWWTRNKPLLERWKSAVKKNAQDHVRCG